MPLRKRIEEDAVLLPARRVCFRVRSQRSLSGPAHVALVDERIANEVVGALGGHDFIGHVIEISIPPDEGDAKSFTAFIFESDAGTVGRNHEWDV